MMMLLWTCDSCGQVLTSQLTNQAMTHDHHKSLGCCLVSHESCSESLVEVVPLCRSGK